MARAPTPDLFAALHAPLEEPPSLLDAARRVWACPVCGGMLVKGGTCSHDGQDVAVKPLDPDAARELRVDRVDELREELQRAEAAVDPDPKPYLVRE